ncbi:MAG: prenyltransferase [Schumannella sp.]
MIRNLLLASRPLSWVNTAYPFAAAYLLATGGRIDAPLVVGALFFLVPYNLLMYGVNDVFDYASDARNPRKGGAEGALLPPRMHRATLWAAALLAAPFVVYLVVVGGPISRAVLAVSLFAVLAYSVPVLRFKERPVLDSVTSSTHFVSPAVYGIALAAGAFGTPVVALLGAFFLWGAASHAFGAVQDVVADREAGIRSIATAFGARATVRLAIGCYLASSVLLVVCAGLGGGWPAAVAALLPLPYALNAAPWRGVADEDSPSANRGWRRFLWLNYLTGFGVTVLLIAHALAA